LQPGKLFAELMIAEADPVEMLERKVDRLCPSCWSVLRRRRRGDSGAGRGEFLLRGGCFDVTLTSRHNGKV
jgi:hypothetical protein